MAGIMPHFVDNSTLAPAAKIVGVCLKTGKSQIVCVTRYQRLGSLPNSQNTRSCEKVSTSRRNVPV